MEPMTDGELLGAFAAGDQKAFAELVRRHADWVWGCALRQAADGAAAEDMAQGAFLLLAQKAPSLKDRSSVQGWLFRVVSFLARDARKLANRRKYHETRVAAMNREQTPQGRAWDAIQGVLDEAVANLREQDRQTILLRFYRGMSVVEVAGALRVSEDAAGKRVSRAVDRLREILGRQGLNTGAQVQELLTSGLACAAPAALVTQLSAGGGTATAAAMAAKGSKLLLIAKAKLVATLAGATVLTVATVGGLVVLSQSARPAPSRLATPASAPATALVHSPESIVQAPPVRPGKSTVAVCAATLVLPQSAVDELVAATKVVAADPGIQTRIGDAMAVRPILRDLIPLHTGGSTLLRWDRQSTMGGIGGSSGQLRFGTPIEELASLTFNVSVRAGAVTQLTGNYRLKGSSTAVAPLNFAFSPATLLPGQVLIHVIPVNPTPRLRRNVVLVYEAVQVDLADLYVLRNFPRITDWYARPVAEQLRLARAGSTWLHQVPPQDWPSFARTQWGKKLPGGAELWLNDIYDPAVHPRLAWAADGTPATLAPGTPSQRDDEATPVANVRIVDPNVPSAFTPPGPDVQFAPVALMRQGNGYACRIGYGDGPYKTVARMPMRDGATAKVGDCTIRVENVNGLGGGDFVTTGELPADTDVDVCVLLRDGSRALDQVRHDRSVREGVRVRLGARFYYRAPADQIETMEVRTRPIVWVSFDGLAMRPSVPLPTGMEDAVDREEGRETVMVNAAPPDRKAFLDKVQCLHMRNESTASGVTGKTDTWIWRDGRYRSEGGSGSNHWLKRGDRTIDWQYDFTAEKWTASKDGRPSNCDFVLMSKQIGGLEAMVAMGDTVGKEEVNGVPCTVRSARVESGDAKVWLDSLGLIHRLDYAFKTSSETVVIDYDPAGAERAWELPAGAQRPGGK